MVAKRCSIYDPRAEKTAERLIGSLNVTKGTEDAAALILQGAWARGCADISGIPVEDINIPYSKFEVKTENEIVQAALIIAGTLVLLRILR